MKTGVAVLVLSAMLTGCGPDNFETFDSEGGASAHMDASRRLLLVTNHGGRDGNRRVVCAEPSPDSVTSFAAAMAANGKVTPAGGTESSVQAGVSGSYAENAAFIGMRSQTIQLLRDGLYRACEAYANGAIDEAEYNVLLVNIGQIMVTLVAIDGLTGRPAAPAVVVGASKTTITKDENGNPITTTEPVISKIGDVPATKSAAEAKEIAAAVTEIASKAADRKTTSALCMSFMASDRYRTGMSGRGYDNPNFAKVAAYCDAVFKGRAKS